MSTQTSFVPPDTPFAPEAFTVQCDLAALFKAVARDGLLRFPLEVVTYTEEATPEGASVPVIHRREGYAQVLPNGALCIDIAALPR